MSYRVYLTRDFKRDTKRLKKKYPSIVSDVSGLIEQLQERPDMGVLIKANLYKVRVAIKSKGRGKSGGGRVIYLVLQSSVEEGYLGLISLYDKSQQESHSDDQIEEAILEAIEAFEDAESSDGVDPVS